VQPINGVRQWWILTTANVVGANFARMKIENRGWRSSRWTNAGTNADALVYQINTENDDASGLHVQFKGLIWLGEKSILFTFWRWWLHLCLSSALVTPPILIIGVGDSTYAYHRRWWLHLHLSSALVTPPILIIGVGYSTYAYHRRWWLHLCLSSALVTPSILIIGVN
jgi:hypothetical protein